MIHEIHVTQEDINFGERRNCKKCPIALAINRVFPDKFVSVSPFGVYTIDRTTLETIRYGIPSYASQFIEDFDCHPEFKPEPFSFEIDSEKGW